jgi:hypothetical protein
LDKKDFPTKVACGRNILDNCPRALKSELKPKPKLLFDASDLVAARKLLDDIMAESLSLNTELSAGLQHPGRCRDGSECYMAAAWAMISADEYTAVIGIVGSFAVLC